LNGKFNLIIESSHSSILKIVLKEIDVMSTKKNV